MTIKLISKTFQTDNLGLCFAKLRVSKIIITTAHSPVQKWIVILKQRCLATHYGYAYLLQEQDKSSDIEQQQP